MDMTILGPRPRFHFVRMDTNGPYWRYNTTPIKLRYSSVPNTDNWNVEYYRMNDDGTETVISSCVLPREALAQVRKKHQPLVQIASSNKSNVPIKKSEPSFRIYDYSDDDWKPLWNSYEEEEKFWATIRAILRKA